VTLIATAILPTSGLGEARFNGTSAVSTSVRPPSSTFTAANRIGGDGGNNSNVLIAEMGWYTRDITTLERAKLEQYLAKKWGVTLP
jgi:hypothetical protein